MLVYLTIWIYNIQVSFKWCFLVEKESLKIMIYLESLVSSYLEFTYLISILFSYDSYCISLDLYHKLNLLIKNGYKHILENGNIFLHKISADKESHDEMFLLLSLLLLSLHLHLGFLMVNTQKYFELLIEKMASLKLLQQFRLSEI